jgi:pimeloyl-ACP methyl ester carboxylesterase
MKLRSFDGPVAVLLAGRDAVVPDLHTMALYDAIVGQKKLWLFERAGHNYWPAAPDETRWREVMDFFAMNVVSATGKYKQSTTESTEYTEQ